VNTSKKKNLCGQADRFNYILNCSRHRFYKVWFGSKVLTLRPIIEVN
jgi:hypothetical protein